MNDEFITNIKQKITAKNEKVPEEFHYVTMSSYKGRNTKEIAKQNFKRFPHGTPGKNRMKSLMRSYVYLPKMDKDITDMIEKCKGCALAAKAPPLLSNLGQNRTTLVEDTCWFCGSPGRFQLPNCSG